ncbi:MAG: DNA polymerase I, partial [Catalinimonas sp.]
KHHFVPALEPNAERLLHEVEGPLIPVLTEMELAGVRIDSGALGELSTSLGDAAATLEQRVHEAAGEVFNLGSPKQLGEILFDKLKLSDKPKKTKSGQYATNEQVLSAYVADHAIVRDLLDYRELQKLKSTYVDALPALINARTGRVHTSFNQAVTATGRLSSSNPNLQNIPIRTEQGREIRKAFVPRDADHVILAADYSQIELRIMAAFSSDESMTQAFREGRDVHATSAAKVYGVPLDEVTPEQRRNAKTLNFAIIYGVSAFGLAQRLYLSRQEAAATIEAYFKEFPAIKAYMDDAIARARNDGYVSTVLGRRRYLPDIHSRNPTVRGFAERNAINMPIQGTAADMIKLAMIRVHDWMQREKLRSRMVLQVHDELVFDAHRDEVETLQEHVVAYMRDALPLAVPMEIGLGTGQNWLAAH